MVPEITAERHTYINSVVKTHFLDSIENPFSWFVIKPPGFKRRYKSLGIFRTRNSFIIRKARYLFRTFKPYVIDSLIKHKNMVVH